MIKDHKTHDLALTEVSGKRGRRLKPKTRRTLITGGQLHDLMTAATAVQHGPNVRSGTTTQGKAKKTAFRKAKSVRQIKGTMRTVRLDRKDPPEIREEIKAGKFAPNPLKDLRNIKM